MYAQYQTMSFILRILFYTTEKNIIEIQVTGIRCFLNELKKRRIFAVLYFRNWMRRIYSMYTRTFRCRIRAGVLDDVSRFRGSRLLMVWRILGRGECAILSYHFVSPKSCFVEGAVYATTLTQTLLSLRFVQIRKVAGVSVYELYSRN